MKNLPCSPTRTDLDNPRPGPTPFSPQPLPMPRPDAWPGSGAPPFMDPAYSRRKRRIGGPWSPY